MFSSRASVSSEKEIKDSKLQEKLESISPALKPVFAAEKMLLFRLVLLLYLGLWSKSVHSCSLADEFITFLREKENLSIYPYTTKEDLQN